MPLINIEVRRLIIILQLCQQISEATALRRIMAETHVTQIGPEFLMWQRLTLNS